MKFSLWVFLFLAFVLAPLAHATDYTSPSFTVEDPVLSVGGGFATSPSFQLWSAVGQLSIGTSTGPSFGLKAGFLYFPAIIVATGAPPVPPPPVFAPTLPPRLVERVVASCDFNRDRRCNLIDLSILLFYYGRSGPEVDRYDLSRNGKVDFVDVSILFYYWADRT